jgi:hypothetical protein
MAVFGTSLLLMQHVLCRFSWSYATWNWGPIRLRLTARRFKEFTLPGEAIRPTVPIL